jgi:6-phosphogluconolactonase
MSLSSAMKSTVIVGTYVDKANPSIYLSEFDNLTGGLVIQQQLSGVTNPSFLDIDHEKRIAYFIGVNKDGEGTNQTGIAAYQLSPDHLHLTPLYEQSCLPATSCHITLDHTKQNLIVSSYHGGMIGLIAINNHGTLSSHTEIHQHTGSSIHPAQTQSRAHSATIDPSNKFVVVADLGTDKLVIYQLDADQHQLTLHNEMRATPGAGPRHSVFHPTLPFFYVINELNSTITVYKFDCILGTLTEIETLNTLPPDYSDTNACADIHISPDGRFLYGSNRGHDSIVSFEIDSADGTLGLLEHTPTLGEHPRNFAISPDGQYLLVANKNSHNIVTFKRDMKSGRLQAIDQVLNIVEPVCIKFM